MLNIHAHMGLCKDISTNCILRTVDTRTVHKVPCCDMAISQAICLSRIISVAVTKQVKPLTAEDMDRAKDQILATCVRNMWLLSTMFNIFFMVSPVPGTSNNVADLYARVVCHS